MTFAVISDRMGMYGLNGSDRVHTLMHVSRTLHYAALVSRAIGKTGWLEMELLSDALLREHNRFVENDQDCSRAHEEAMRMLSLWEWHVNSVNETCQ